MSKCNSLQKLIVSGFVALAVSGAVWSATDYVPYHWTNGTGDYSLQTAGNWQENVVPKNKSASGDVPGIQCCLQFGEGTTIISNTTEKFESGRYAFNGSSPVTVCGKTPRLVGNGNFWTNTVPVTFETDFSASAWSMGSFRCFAPVDFKKSFTIDGGYYCYWYFSSSTPMDVHFRGPFSMKTPTTKTGNDGLRFSMKHVDSTVHFHDEVNATSNTLFATYADGSGANVYFHGPINYQWFTVQAYRFNLENENVLSPTGGVIWAGSTAYGIVDMKGHDQVAGFLAGTYKSGSAVPDASGRVITSATPATLTVKCTTSAATPVSVQGAVNLVIDAVAPDGVQTFEYRDNTTVGTLIISNGTLRLAKGAKFSKVMSLFIGANGRLEVDADNGVAQPFPSLLRLKTEPGASVSFGSGAFPAGIDATKSSSYSTGAADTVWGETSGNWETAAGWSAGVPTPEKTAAIIGTSSGLTVELTAPADGAKGLLVASPIGMGAKLAVASSLPLADATVTVKGDSEIEVCSGGEIVNVGTVDSTKEASSLTTGGRLTVKSGGTFKMADSSGDFRIGDDGSGKLTVEDGGLFEFDPGKQGAKLVATGEAELDIRGTLAVVRRYEVSNSVNFDFTGDRIRLSGNGMFLSKGGVARGSSAVVGSATTYFRVDDLELSDHAAIATDSDLNWRSSLNFYGKEAGSDATMTFRGDSSISNTFFSAGFYARPRGTLHVDMSQVAHGFTSSSMGTGRANVGYSLTIGSGNGRTRFDYGGAGFSVGEYNFNVGVTSGDTGTSASDPGYAEVNLMNGAVVSSSGGCAINRGSIGATRLSAFYGTTVGSWNKPKSGVTERIQRGRMTLRDAGTQFSVGSGHFIVGLGRGHGQYVQMDGATTICTATGNNAQNTDTWLPKEEQVSYRVYATNSVFMLGAYGGLGECIVSNGTFVSNLRTFVGGITTNQYFDGAYITLGNALNLSDAEGYLRVVGGDFTSSQSIYVGSKGSGLVEIGPRGSLTADALVLSNQTASVLAFTLDKANGFRSGASSVKKLVVTDGASLLVDLGDYDGKSRTLLSFAKKEGDFGNISVVGANEKDYEAFVRPDRIYLRANIGTVLLVR